ncbi:hypothetical protein CEX98_09035 [Pseudoalteromonas piscicida]|uniref:Uncharacterized protein n=1 Tax=Pseudoalteromonas piscicida TaxID=43662 RepID=A0A2A5JRU4_PSEO7|nr:hypothetical protein CEX98_09035 [Pseudoalteromonas piscicida]
MLLISCHFVLKFAHFAGVNQALTALKVSYFNLTSAEQAVLLQLLSLTTAFNVQRLTHKFNP